MQYQLHQSEVIKTNFAFKQKENAQRPVLQV